MFFRVPKYILVIVMLHTPICWSGVAYAQSPVATGADLTNAISLNTINTSILDVNLKGVDGKAVEKAAVVTLLRLTKEPYRQETAKAGHVRFIELAATQYSVQVIVPGYETAVKQVETKKDETSAVTIELRQLSVEDAAENAEYKALAPKAQKEVGKALEALRLNKAAEARSHLDAANRAAPNQAEVQYLYGVYSRQSGDAAQAKSYWMKAVELGPKHLPALLALADALGRENRAAEALPYVTRAIEAEPSSWRAHAIMANVDLHVGSEEQAVKEAERAMELGHEQAVVVQPVLAAALIRQGDKERAARILERYLKERPGDLEAKKQLVYLQTPPAQNSANDRGSAGGDAVLAATVGEGIADALPSSWLPPDIDEQAGALEPGAVCSLKEVMKNTGNRMQEFVSNVEQFAAMETVKHDTIDKWGSASSSTTLKFDYLVSVQEFKPGFFNVDEYRTTHGSSEQFPDGIGTNGLPALALIFHPHQAENFEFTCEGLTRMSSGLAWQVHFRQRADKPNVIRRYRNGLEGPSYRVDLKGRAWIAADTYQIVRLETQMIAPVSKIRLAADYTAIEYGPVHFKGKNLDMWLPQSAEVYADLRGRRFHRRHSFSKYMLFWVDEKQKILFPKTADETPVKPDGDGAGPSPQPR